MTGASPQPEMFKTYSFTKRSDMMNIEEFNKEENS
jgi:hypothetical protein